LTSDNLNLEIKNRLSKYSIFEDNEDPIRFELALNLYRNTLMVSDLRVAFINYWTILEIMLDKKEDGVLLDQDDLRVIRDALSAKYKRNIDRIMSLVGNIDKIGKIDRMNREIKRYLDDTEELKPELNNFRDLRGELVHITSGADDARLSEKLIELKELTERLLKNVLA
jgi:hypothetical protein